MSDTVRPYRDTTHLDTSNKGVIHPDALHPDAIHPGVIHPDAIHPDAIHPGVIHPDAIHPGVIHPDVIHSDAIKRYTTRPTACYMLLIDSFSDSHFLYYLSNHSDASECKLNHLQMRLHSCK